MIQAEIHAPPGSAARDLSRALPDATLHGLRRAGKRLRDDYRKQARAHFGGGLKGKSGKPLHLTILSSTDQGKDGQYPMTVRVRSVARYPRRPGGPVDLLTVYGEGAVIRPTGDRKWLAFPTENAPLRTSGKRLAGPRDASALGGIRLRFIEIEGGRRAVLVNDDPDPSRRKVLFILIKETRRRKLIDLDGPYARESAALPGYVLAALDEKLGQLGGAA